MHVVADRQILARGQRQDAQARVFGGGPQEGEEMIHEPEEYKHIFCMQGQLRGVGVKLLHQPNVLSSLFTSKCTSTVQHIFELRVLWPACGACGMDPGLA
jgi:hypothetical protein